jgi:hypothetical protein
MYLSWRAVLYHVLKFERTLFVPHLRQVQALSKLQWLYISLNSIVSHNTEILTSFAVLISFSLLMPISFKYFMTLY